jgi:hypothetical protein
MYPYGCQDVPFVSDTSTPPCDGISASLPHPSSELPSRGRCPQNGSSHSPAVVMVSWPAIICAKRKSSGYVTVSLSNRKSTGLVYRFDLYPWSFPPRRRWPQNGSCYAPAMVTDGWPANIRKMRNKPRWFVFSNCLFFRAKLCTTFTNHS